MGCTGEVWVRNKKGVGQLTAIPESLLVDIWQHQLAGRVDMLTAEGEPVKIIYPGRLNTDRGADLLDAVIVIGNRLLLGDVEVHVKSSNWWAHRHHQDPVYNSVILHIVLIRDTAAATRLQNDAEVPTLDLIRYLEREGDLQNISRYARKKPAITCLNLVAKIGVSKVGELLDIAGEQRFLAKAIAFQEELTRMEASQVLYQGIMGALGYAKNKAAFLELSRRLPYSILQSVIKSELSDEECLARQQALLLGTAGLLPSQSSSRFSKADDIWVEILEKAWANSCQTEAMLESDWCMCKIRPNNFPTRRIAAMSYLMLRYRGKQMSYEVISKVRKASSEEGCCELEKMLRVTADGYWASHCDFGKESRLVTSALIGSRRAADIVVNVVLPFTFARGKLESQPELAQKALELYYRYPRLATNALEKHMRKQFGLGDNMVNSARQQQGLLHIYKTMCSQGKCYCCPVGEAVAGLDLAAGAV